MTQPFDLPKLERSLRWAIENQLPQRELVALLRPIVAHTDPDSERGELARLQLAEQLLRSTQFYPQIWEAAGLARGLARSTPCRERATRAWGALGLAHTLLGNFRAARVAYHKALALDPREPVCAHNLGHLLDCVWDRPRAALPWLRVAYQELDRDPEVAASFAHALCRTGAREQARLVLLRARVPTSQAAELIESWSPGARTPERVI